ncbi:hypothetical protein M885DRAFT_504869 [Pelagophyceae sp. CCMP2097]|nr:hypothetical protein M885DRAFT_504869 [Pelagophyceae sp. CCMP2097]
MQPMWRLCVVLTAVSGVRRAARFSAISRGGEVDESEEAFGMAFSKGMKHADMNLVDVEADLSSGKPFSDLGAKFDDVFEASMAVFDSAVPKSAAALGARKALFERSLDAKLELVFVKQLVSLRARLLAMPVSADGDSAKKLEAAFATAAAGSRRTGAAWDFESEQKSIGAVASEIAARARRANTIATKAAQQQQSYMELFQMYQSQIAQLQAATAGAPPSFSVSYRVPDTDVAMSASKSAERTTFTIGSVPDETSPGLLGPHGFVKGLTPANVGITLNVHRG